MRLAKADFYYGALLSQLINNEFAPAIIEPGDSRRIYRLYTNSDYAIYMKYVANTASKSGTDTDSNSNGSKRWAFSFSKEEIQEILAKDNLNIFAFICGEKNLKETKLVLITKEQLQMCLGINNISFNITPQRQVSIRLEKKGSRSFQVYGTGLSINKPLKITRNVEKRLQEFTPVHV